MEMFLIVMETELEKYLEGVISKHDIRLIKLEGIFSQHGLRLIQLEGIIDLY